MRRILMICLCLTLLCPCTASAAEAPKYIALTFDDGPSGRYTRRLLEGLDRRGAKATFFLCGYRLEQYPELAGQMVQQGHEIGLHGYSHRDMSALSRRDIARELSDTAALLPEHCRVRFLRPPGGCCSDGVRQVARAAGLAIADWSVDPRDWATQDTAAIGRSILDRVEDGDVVLLHDMTDSSVDAALSIVTQLQERGFCFVTLSELARIRNVTLRPGAVYRRFPSD